MEPHRRHRASWTRRDQCQGKGFGMGTISGLSGAVPASLPRTSTLPGWTGIAWPRDPFTLGIAGVAAIVITLALGLILVLRPRRCTLCAHPLTHRGYRWKLDGRRHCLCPDCNAREHWRRATTQLAAAGDPSPSATAIRRCPTSSRQDVGDHPTPPPGNGA